MASNTSPDYTIKMDRVGTRMSAILESPHFDQLLHPSGSAKIVFGSLPQRKAGTIDSFQVNSVIEYLKLQGVIRIAIELEIEALQKRSNQSDEAISVNIWNTSQVEEIWFDPRIVQTHESLAPLARKMKRGKMQGLTEEDIASIIAASDKPDTRTTFSVLVRTTIDEDDYRYTAAFRDGGLVEFSAS